MDDLVGKPAEAQSSGEAGVMSEALWETLSMCSSLYVQHRPSLESRR